MRRLALWRLFCLGVALSLIVTGLPPAATQPTQAQTEAGVLYVAIIWHQHQPVYFKDPETGVYQRPWVRVHATKDYLDMAAMLQQYPDIHVTFNITPSLIRQLDDLAAGAQDLYWVLSEVPADQLTDEQKRFILERFFDTNPRVIGRFPRYQELANSRAALGVDGALAAWTVQDFRDLQILFNLAWTDPDWLAQEPLARLVAQERDYVEEDKAVLFAEHLRIIREVIPLHAQLQNAGQIEVTMTPFAHPILPLLVDSDVAAVALPDATLPERFVFGQDAVGQLEMGVQLYRDHFGVAPRGMWPAEGSVSQQIVQMVASAGIRWIASDEEVLANSLPDFPGFTRNSADTVQQADAMYRPYLLTGRRGGQVAIVFRDRLISDKVGFEYSGMDGEEAAADFIRRLNDIQAELEAEGASGPNLVTVILDGENAWEYYANDGKDFLHALYRGLSEAENLRTVTPSEYLAMTEPPRPIENLWPGSWISSDFSTWIGEEEENQAWTYLLQTRNALQAASNRLDEETLRRALETMYIAEGSDWFWWYGADQNSGSDDSFDQQFRSYLAQVYEIIGQPVPDFVQAPIIAQAAQQPDRPATEALTVVVDGSADEAEWATAAAYALETPPLTGLYYGFDNENFYLRTDAAGGFADGSTLGFYLRLPGDYPTNAFSRYGQGEMPLGFGAERLIEVTFADGVPAAALYTANGQGGWTRNAAIETVAAAEDTVEIAVPVGLLVPQRGRDNRIDLRLVYSEGETDVAIAPPQGPALAALPDEAIPNTVIDLADPVGDDNGPGTYVYPTDAVFRRGAYDARNFIVGSNENDVIFRIDMNGAVENDWGAPNGMGIITVDVYIDVDGPANGARLLLPGRNAALTADFGWDYAVWAEGWTPGVFRPGPEGPVQVEGSSLAITTNSGLRQITIRVPRSVIPGDPATWAYAVAVLSQEGYPAAGVWRVREVLPTAEQWRFGGGTTDTNHTRIIDLIWPEGSTPTQADMLGTYPPSSADVDTLTPDDFPQVQMFRAE